jgi:DNA-3-methyladenine glycosylase II
MSRNRHHKQALLHLRGADPVLAGIIGRVGKYAIQYSEPDFATLVRSIVFQQLSGKAARTILDRLQGACRGRRITPGAMLRLSVEEMRALGLSQQKAAYIRDLAEHTRSRRLKFSRLEAMADQDVIAELTQVKGIGVWTAHMFLLFALGRPDVLPTGDLGVRSAIRKAYGLDELPTPAEMERIAACWRPYCSVASWYLWRSLEGEAAI